MYLIILAALLSFFCLSLYYSQNNASTFAETIVPQQAIKEVYKLDTRYKYPTLPPVNPNIHQAVVLNSVPAEHDLFSKQELVNGYILNQNENGSTNQLDYSGGTTQLIKIPLQMNDPYNEQLRSQEILITPYNTIKYKNC
jgi:hypothetical protein